jgi:hypothetical protein
MLCPIFLEARLARDCALVETLGAVIGIQCNNTPHYDNRQIKTAQANTAAETTHRSELSKGCLSLRFAHLAVSPMATTAANPVNVVI